MCVRRYPGGVSSVCLVRVHGWKRELSVYRKNKQEAMLWWFIVSICLRICKGMMLLKATRKQESIEVPLSALWCCIVIHNRVSALCHIIGNVLTFLIESVASQTHTRSRSHFGSTTAPPSGQHQPGPSHSRGTRSPSSRCLRSARRRGYGAAVAGVMAGSKGWSRRPAVAGCWRQSRLLMSGHQINNLFISPRRGNRRVMCCSNKSILHVVIHCAKSHFSSMITFLCASIANKKKPCQYD